MEELKYFTTTAKELENDEIKRWKADGKKVIGIQCSNLPEEIILAAGILPVRIRANSVSDTSNADAHLHRINCSYTRSVLELLMTGGLSFLDGIITTNTCDHHMRLAGEIMKASKTPAHYFEMYHTLNENARDWFVSEIGKMISFLEKNYGVKIDEASLKNSISIYNKTRLLMTRLGELRKSDPPAVSGREYMDIAITGMSIPREVFNEKLEKLIEKLAGRKVFEKQSPRLLVMGAACDSPGLIDFIEQRGVSVVADNICFGLRHFSGQIDEGGDPVRSIANRYFERIPCPSAIDHIDLSLKYMKQIINDLNVNGIISVRLKFCDHWAGLNKLIHEKLSEELNVPMLELEREYSSTSSGQLSTRLQAFIEVLNG